MKRSQSEQVEQESAKSASSKSLWKKIGIAGFLFFLLKGIAWLVFAYFIFK